ncbi:MAG: class I SAM-dependent methyltransferase [Acidobacteria bacterium]|nr:MAG: class I SAM-dependent methyltransferase [Acidobacteriota bacterium]RPJ62716.1 MAG: class I SAM-dependent methyltransferase [Acidobacteriota bacterium]
MATATVPTIDEEKMQSFLNQVLCDVGASLSSTLVYIGQKLGLYRALRDTGPLISAELAQKTGTVERYVREWLINQAAGGYISYDPHTGKYSMTPEQATALTDEASPYYVGGGFYVVKALAFAAPRIETLFKNGGGMLWKDHDADLFVGTEKFFRPGYMAHLVNEWIPSLDGVAERLKKGGRVADVGCGHGASTVIMAKAYPKSEFFGFDNHEASIIHARERAKESGVDNRVRFEVSDAVGFPGSNYDLVTFFDCLHDMGDPVGAMRRTHETLKPGGSVMIVEPMAGERIEDNFNPVGRCSSAASTLCCTANSLALGGPALGAIATESKLRETATAGGFGSFRRVAETPFNRVFQARK